ncbi:hypothetical protein SLA2020_193220 [Shorea laevis]
MAKWISSKLKATKTTLQQFYQQAVELLTKNERPRFDELKLNTLTKSSDVVSLKDQLKKKMQENNYRGKLHSDSNVNSVNDNDWTVLLGTPSQGRSSSRKQNNGLSTIHGLRKDGKRSGSLGSNLLLTEGKRNSNAVKSIRRSDIALGAKLIGRPSDSEESSSLGRPSSVDMQNDGKNSEGLLLDQALELQTTMMEMMEAIELTANVDLARRKVLGAIILQLMPHWFMINQVAELWQQIVSKEVAHEELRSRISSSVTHQPRTYQNQLAALKGQKTKQLEFNIELTRKKIEEPTEVEVELKRRLGQLTDHLIQKQAQVEALSSEKATLLFRIETVSRTLDKAPRDLESGKWELSESKLKPLQDKIRFRQKHLGSLLLQLDAIFSTGVVFLRKNPAIKMWSGAVIFLENINNTAGV